MIFDRARAQPKRDSSILPHRRNGLCIKSNASPLAVEGAGVLCLWIFSMAEDDQDIARSLARAFDSVRESYYRARRVTVGQAVSRTSDLSNSLERAFGMSTLLRKQA
jgi:hypothetical protein